MAVLTMIILLFSIFSYAQFLTGIEQRPGFSFTDPFHALMGPVDLTWPIFIVLYATLIGMLGVLLRQPTILFRVFRAYTILIAIRMLCMWMLPLDPPATMIVLSDPVVELVTAAGSSPLTRDLFFSGHVSVFFLIGALVPHSTVRRVLFGLGTLIGIALIAQHVHYTVDVLVAPMAALTAAHLSGAPLFRG